MTIISEVPSNTSVSIISLKSKSDALKPQKNQRVPVRFMCRHSGCDSLFLTDSERTHHEKSARFHFQTCGVPTKDEIKQLSGEKSHKSEHHTGCDMCRHMWSTGVWNLKKSIFADALLCPHKGCNSFPLYTRFGGAKQSLYRHAIAIHVHGSHVYEHWKGLNIHTDASTCDCCNFVADSKQGLEDIHTYLSEREQIDRLKNNICTSATFSKMRTVQRTLSKEKNNTNSLVFSRLASQYADSQMCPKCLCGCEFGFVCRDFMIDIIRGELKSIIIDNVLEIPSHFNTLWNTIPNFPESSWSLCSTFKHIYMAQSRKHMAFFHNNDVSNERLASAVQYDIVDTHTTLDGSSDQAFDISPSISDGEEYNQSNSIEQTPQKKRVVSKSISIKPMDSLHKNSPIACRKQPLRKTTTKKRSYSDAFDNYEEIDDVDESDECAPLPRKKQCMVSLKSPHVPLSMNLPQMTDGHKTIRNPKWTNSSEETRCFSKSQLPILKNVEHDFLQSYIPTPVFPLSHRCDLQKESLSIFTEEPTTKHLQTTDIFSLNDLGKDVPDLNMFSHLEPLFDDL